MLRKDFVFDIWEIPTFVGMSELIVRHCEAAHAADAIQGSLFRVRNSGLPRRLAAARSDGSLRNPKAAVREW